MHWYLGDMPCRRFSEIALAYCSLRIRNSHPRVRAKARLTRAQPLPNLARLCRPYGAHALRFDLKPLGGTRLRITAVSCCSLGKFFDLLQRNLVQALVELHCQVLFCNQKSFYIRSGQYAASEPEKMRCLVLESDRHIDIRGQI